LKIVTVTDAVDLRGNMTNGVRVGNALRRLGHDVSRIDHLGVNGAALDGAELVLAFGTLIKPDRARWGAFQRLRDVMPQGARLALWYFDMVNPSLRHDTFKYPILLSVCQHLDFLAMTDHSYPWETHVPRFLHLMQGVEPKDFSIKVAPPEPRRWDVIFTGGMTRPFHDRRALIDALRPKFLVATYGRGSAGRVDGKAFIDAYQRSRVALVPPPPREATAGYWSNRLYLAAATGTPCVVGHAPGIEAHYEDGREVVYFRDRKEMVGAVDTLVRNAGFRRKMGLAARERTLAEHTYDKRCERLLEAIWESR
jgi:hypothetical protein